MNNEPQHRCITHKYVWGTKAQSLFILYPYWNKFCSYSPDILSMQWDEREGVQVKVHPAFFTLIFLHQWIYKGHGHQCRIFSLAYSPEIRYYLLKFLFLHIELFIYYEPAAIAASFFYYIDGILGTSLEVKQHIKIKIRPRSASVLT